MRNDERGEEREYKSYLDYLCSDYGLAFSQNIPPTTFEGMMHYWVQWGGKMDRRMSVWELGCCEYRQFRLSHKTYTTLPWSLMTHNREGSSTRMRCPLLNSITALTPAEIPAVMVKKFGASVYA